MRVSLIKENKIKHVLLPDSISGNYWISDIDKNGNEHNLINIEASSDGWKLISNSEVSVVQNGIYIPDVALHEYNFYNIKDIASNHTFLVYCSPVYEKNVNYYDLSSIKNEFTIGRSSNCDLVYKFNAVSDFCAKLTFEGEKIKIHDNGFQYGIFVNGVRVNGVAELEYGDVVFILGLKLSIIISSGNRYLMCNNPNGVVSCNLMAQNLIENEDSFKEDENELEMELYEPDSYFHKKPRFIHSIQKLELKVDAPPEKNDEDDSPFILTVGPMVTMSMMSLMMMYSAINNVSNGSKLSSAIPSLVMGIAMFASTLVWPIITKKYQKAKRKKQEKLRQEKYGEYIDEKQKKILEERKNQESILNNKYPNLGECASIILNKQVNLWERRKEDDDFLTVSLGLGQLPMDIHIGYPEEHFSLASDNLKDMLNKLGSEPKTLSNVPIPFSLSENYITGIIGNEANNKCLIENILLQLLAFHSYDDVKFVLFTNEEKESNWEYMKILPHLWSDDRTIRYFASNQDEYKELCYNLDRILYERLENSSKVTKQAEYREKYVIITDSFKSIRNFDFIKKILEEKKNLGFSIIILNDKISTLPDQCQVFINTSDKQSEMFKNVSMNDSQKFTLDMDTKYDIYKCSKVLSNIPIEIDSDSSGQIPSKLGFLEMYDVGKIEQLNSMSRWMKNTPILNIQVPVGIGKSGEKINLDLHEKYHGPHGLIAGMTGSGKSEFIITYILSLAVNYHPYEVQFILIDYKGGGLAGAFENKVTGIKLPHLVGTITNLDTNEIKRSLASLESELKRRQRIFNEAREKTGESTIDIYKYQKMYRDHVVDVPVSHLFIIADEFAEMKQQQPEFMEHLIQTARIGRSLGVHLILATQKPSGVVDSQIWSNTRFRVCLRVQDKSDSTEVIKCPDAALLKQTGRFYLQVGFNEVFVLGQSAWTGGKYIPSPKIKKNIDTSLQVIDNIGYSVKTMETKKKNENVVSKGEELSNILKYLSDIAAEQHISCKPLWLDAIPSFITVDDLSNKYNYIKDDYDINPIIGEYDVPSMQAQHLLTLSLKDGNILVYGGTGSGKENFITTMIYSSMLTYTALDVNYYIMDFGSEVLRYFDKCPIVGDIVGINDTEKVSKLFSIIKDEIELRKKLFADYNGSYENYCKNSGSKKPAIVVVINNYEAYQETYTDYEDLLNIITRDCSKYGIYFLLTITNPNGIRFKLKQNFTQIFALNQNNNDDFTTILGNVHKVYPSKYFGRGIIRKDDVYEFQTALVCEKDNIASYIKEKCMSMNPSVRANKIPTLPEVVTYDDIKSFTNKQNNPIIGIDKNDLKPIDFDFKKNFVTIVSSIDLANNISFANGLIYQICKRKSSDLIVINAEDYACDDKLVKSCTYVDNSFNKIFETIHNYVSENNKLYVNNNYNKDIFKNKKHMHCIIIGIDAFKNKISMENKNKFNEIFEPAKDLGIIDYIIIDSIDKIKKYEFESWYKTCVNASEGIWIGQGINDQFTLKVSVKTKEMKEDVKNNFCFVIKKGRPILVKYVSSYELDENDDIEEIEIL